MDVTDRKQQTIRSRLLLIKVGMLKQDQVLPKGFDSIKLDRTTLDKVSGFGKNPYRKESDIDSRGRPTNTEWDATQVPPLKEVGLSRL